MDRANAGTRTDLGRTAKLEWQGLLIVFTGLPLLIFVLSRWPGFDGLYGQDAYAYFAYAMGPLAQALETGARLPPFFWPPGYPLSILFSAFATGSTARAGQAASLMAGFLLPILTALLAREAGRSLEKRRGRDSGVAAWIAPLSAGLIAGMVPQLWQSSAVVMADTTGLAACTLGVWSLIRYTRAAGRRAAQASRTKVWASLSWLLLATGGLSFAILSRWGYALIAIPCMIYALAFWLRMPRLTVVRDLGLALLTAVFLLRPVLVPALQEVFGSAPPESGFVGDLRVYSWSAANAFKRAFATTDGFQQYRLPNGLYYALLPGHRYYFTPIIALFLLPGLLVIWQHRTRPQLLLLAWAAMIYIFHAGAPWQNFRFALAYLPPLATIAGIGIDELWNRPLRRFRWAIGLWFLAGLVLMAAGGISLTDSFIERKNRSLAIMRQVEDILPADGTLITFGLTGAYQHYYDRQVLELFTLRAEDLQPAIDRGEPYFLLADLDNVRTQWAGRTPAQNLHYVETNTRVLPLGEFPPYTLLGLEP